MRVPQIILILWLGVQTIYAQESIDVFLAKSLAENDISKVLPSLDSLLNAAKGHSSNLKFYDSEYDYRKRQIRLERRAWMNYLNFETNYGYGVYDNLSNQQIAGDPESSQALFTTEQDRYTVGVSLKIPLSAFLNRNAEIRAKQAEAEKASFQKDAAFQELQQVVIKQYSDVLVSHRMMIISSASVETYKVQMIRAEKDFTNGVINIAEYARLQNMLTDAIKSFESQKGAFLLAIMYLEGTVGIELNI